MRFQIRHFYWIFIGPSFAVRISFSLFSHVDMNKLGHWTEWQQVCLWKSKTNLKTVSPTKTNLIFSSLFYLYLCLLLLTTTLKRHICLVPTLQMKGQWEFNINVLFEISFTLKPNKKLTTMINSFHLWSIILQIGNMFVGNLCGLSAQPQEQRGGQGNAANSCLAAVPCPSLRSCGWAESSLTQYREIDIPNKTDRGNI